MNPMMYVVENRDELLDPIFVVGCPRSGTSVLARIIASCDSVCYLGEQALVSDFYARVAPLVPAISRVPAGESKYQTNTEREDKVSAGPISGRGFKSQVQPEDN